LRQNQKITQTKIHDENGEFLLSTRTTLKQLQTTMTTIKEILTLYKFPFSESGKNWQKNWIQIQCPFCNDHSDHGGFNLEKNYYNCWRCGWHKLEDVFKQILPISKPQINSILRTLQYDYNRRTKQVGSIRHGELKLPDGSGLLRKKHTEYLRNRNFDPVELVSVWGLQGTGSIGDYKFRIIAPITFRQRLVSYQGRDITDRQLLRYKACKSKDEITPHKHLLYGFDLAKKSDRVIICEGITDVWRIGPGAIATFGTSYTEEQLRLMMRFNHALILLDADADEKANKLAAELSGILQGEVAIWKLERGDPAQLNQEQVKQIRKEWF